MVNQYTSKKGKEKYIKERIGKRFGKLIVLERTGTQKGGDTLWKCQCDCGNKKIISMGSLTSGHTKSCGCLIKERIIDIRDKKFGKWKVLNKNPIPTKGGNYWKCKCDCGTIKEISSMHLRKGISKSCGCSFRLPEGESSFRWLYNHYKKNNAKKRGHEWGLTIEEFRKITKGKCYYCNEEPKNILDRSSSNANGIYTYNGVDRIDNTKGYIKSNVVSCCKDCNIMKMEKTKEEFIEKAKKIIKINKQKIRPTDINPSYSYNQGNKKKNERIVFKHWNDLIFGDKKNKEKDTTYSNLWLYRTAKEIEEFKDPIGSKSQTQAKKEGKEYFSEFNPLIAENIINFWSDEKDIILDPFAGRTRGIVAGLKHRKYYGFEISPSVHKIVNEMIKKNKEKFDKGYIPKLICDDSRYLLRYDIPEVDLIFSCPPYHNLEKYESVKGQLSDIKDYDKFLESMKEIMNNSIKLLKNNGFVCLVVGDFRRNEELISFDNDTITMMKELGLVLWDKIVLQNISLGWAGIKFGNIKHKRITSKVTEYLLVFKKV